MPNWIWFSELIKKSKKPVLVLNLFAYTGGATLAAAQAGASVCHVDGSKVAVNWAKENAKISKLDDKPIRWIIEDVLTFVKREARRGRLYDGIIMDPPAFGHGPKKELWKIEKDFLALLSEIRKILSPKPLFFLINGYASGYSAIAYENNLKSVLRKFNGQFEKGELTIEEKISGRLLPCGIFSRWKIN
jgi:23S rRNA (cytosine1962-C5)-methyltransferase